MKKLFCCLCAVFISGLLVVQCVDKPTQTAGTGSGTGNAKVSGRIYNPDSTPAKHAKVFFIAVDNNPYGAAKTLAVADSVFTDSTGWYGTNDLPADTYNVFATGVTDSLGFQDSIPFNGDTTVVPPDTLGKPGSIRGFIKLQPGDDPTKIIPIIMGSNKFTFVGASADFALADLAEGTYQVRFFSTLDNYDNLDTTLSVISGKDSLLTDSIELELKIPIPTGLKISYDTLKQIVTLSWDRMDPAKVKGYNVYRKRSDSAEVLLNQAAPITDTFYVDSTGIQDQAYIYSVASVSLSDEIGMKAGGDSVTIASAFKLITIFGNGTGTGQGYFRGLGAITVDLNGYIFCSDVADRRIQKFDSLGSYLLEWGSIGTGLGQFAGEITDIAIDSFGNVYALDGESKRVQKFDNSGNYLTEWNAEGSIDGSATGNFRIAIKGGFVYVGNTDRIQKFDLDGNFIQNIDVSGNLSFMGIAVTDSLVFAATYGTPGNILKISQAGTTIDTIYTGLASVGTYGYEIRSMAVDINRNLIYFIDFSKHKMVAVSFEGALVCQFKISLTDIDNFASDVAVNPANSEVLLGRSKGYMEIYRAVVIPKL